MNGLFRKYKCTFLISLVLIAIFCPKSVKSQKKFDKSNLSFNVAYQFNIYGQYQQKEMQGAKLFDHSFARSNEFGLGLSYKFGNKSIVQFSVSKSYYFGIIDLTNEYETAIDKLSKGYINNNVLTIYYGIGDDAKYCRFQYFKVDLSYGFHYKLSEKQDISILGGLSIMHFIPFSSHQAIIVYDTAQYMDAPLLMSYHTNSRYENGYINNYNAIDLGINIALQYSVRVFSRLDFSMGIKANYTYREISKSYYRTAPSSPMQGSGVLVQPISHLGISAGFNYFFAKPK